MASETCAAKSEADICKVRHRSLKPLRKVTAPLSEDLREVLRRHDDGSFALQIERYLVRPPALELVSCAQRIALLPQIQRHGAGARFARIRCEQLARADEFKLDRDRFSGQITLRALNDIMQAVLVRQIDIVSAVSVLRHRGWHAGAVPYAPAAGGGRVRWHVRKAAIFFPGSN